jgi:xanthine dehydrogenase accessory factor
MDIYIEPYLPQQRLVLIAQGGKDDVEDALVRMGKSLDFDVVVIDHSPVLSEQPDELIKDVDYDIGKFPFANTDSVVVLTRGERDVTTLVSLSKVKLRYVGMLGSRQRIREDLAKLREGGVGEQFVQSLRAPIGADIGAVTATEIALSILSEVVAAKYGKDVLRKALLEGKPKEIPS